MFGCKDASAIVRQQHESGAIRAASFRGDRDLADAAANGLNASSAGMANALDQVRRRRARTLLQQVPMVTNGDRLAVVEAFYVSDHLGEDTTEPVADGDDASTIKLRRLNVQQVVDAIVR